MPLTTEPWPTGRMRAVVFNTEAAYYFLTSARYRADVEGATHVYCDGAGLAAYIRRTFRCEVSRRHGPDVMHAYLESRTGARVLMLGGMAEAHAGVRRRYPAFFARNQVAVDTARLVETDFEAKAHEIVGGQFDDVLIFLGLRRQEHMQRLLHDAGFAGASIGLGAAIDFLGGTKARAGLVWQRIGLEWLPRLLREPRMLPRVARSFGLFGLAGASNNSFLRDFLFGSAGDRSDTVR